MPFDQAKYIMSDQTLIVERDGNWIPFILMGLPHGFLAIVAAKQIYEEIIGQSALTSGFWICIVMLTYCIPLTFYYFAFGTRKKRIFEITQEGILTSDSQLLNWLDIYAIETNDYPGPRMRFYTMKVMFISFERKNVKMIFSSDIKPSWEEISDVMANYTAKYNINIA